MADDAEPTPAPRPRRRRTDVDPTIKARRMPGGRRRADLVPDVILPVEPIEYLGLPDASAADTLALDETAIRVAMADDARPEVAASPIDAEPAVDQPTTRFLTPGAPPAGVRTAPIDAMGGSGQGSWLPVLDDRSPDPGVCPFLRAVGPGEDLVAPIEVPDPANRCAALREAVPQSLRQQELVCLASGHVNCPRYLRGALVVTEAAEPVVQAGGSLTPAVLGSLVVLVMAFSLSIAFVMARGGMELTAALPTPSPAASSTAVAAASLAPTIAPSHRTLPSVGPTASPSPMPSPTPSPSPTPTATPTPTAKPTPKPTPKATPKPTSDRYALLRPCPGTPRCWIYRVRAGDNLYSIANYFGVSVDSIYDRNPWVRNGLRPGQDLRLPPPTR